MLLARDHSWYFKAIYLVTGCDMVIATALLSASTPLNFSCLQDECTAWTNDKHNSYLYDLEMSFVEQLYQSKSVLARCSGHNLIDLNISQKQIINLNDASHKVDELLMLLNYIPGWVGKLPKLTVFITFVLCQHKDSCNGCWQKVKCAAGEPISCSTSADCHASLESEKTHHSKHRGMNCHPSPAKIPALLKHKGTWEQGKGMISHGIQTCSNDSIDLTTGDLKPSLS